MLKILLIWDVAGWNLSGSFPRGYNLILGPKICPLRSTLPIDSAIRAGFKSGHGRPMNAAIADKYKDKLKARCWAELDKVGMSTITDHKNMEMDG